MTKESSTQDFIEMKHANEQAVEETQEMGSQNVVEMEDNAV